jgi:hypothetical protein
MSLFYESIISHVRTSALEMGVVAMAVAVVVPPARFSEVRKSREDDDEDHQQRRRASSSPHLSFSLGFWSSLARTGASVFLLRPL